MDDLTLQDLARKAGVALAQQGLMLATAESCTGGWLGQTITSIAGSSSWYDRGFITYASVSKHEMLGVSTATLEQYGAVSEQTASEMAAGVITHSHAHVAVSITGFTEGAPGQPAGLVHFGCAQRSGPVRHRVECFGAVGRAEVRLSALRVALAMLHDGLSAVAKAA